ncbi:MAG TPA: phosphotransferase family protein [Stellaceae bacterium]|nr:phosphotransferase family protein [Stellaceae bacterium]
MSSTLESSAIERLARHLAARTGAARVVVRELRRLRYGAVQENWALDAVFEGGALAGEQRLVLRADPATGLSESRDKASEFAIMRAVHGAGVAIPEPILCCAERGVIDRPFLVMPRLAGDADGAAIVASPPVARAAIAARLAQELAALHAIRPPRAELDSLGSPPNDAAQARIAALTRALAARDDPYPVAEWALRWLIRHAPPPAPPVLCHRDFRTGNYLVADGRFTALLDWEFAGWSDAGEDIGWFCLGCWRFGARLNEAGGLVRREIFCRAYEAAGGAALEPERLRFWEMLAALRWLVIALEQRDRALLGGEPSLDLALTGRRPAECELEILMLMDAA